MCCIAIIRMEESESKKCFRCGDVGHTKKYCRKRRSGKMLPFGKPPNKRIDTLPRAPHGIALFLDEETDEALRAASKSVIRPSR